MQLSPGVVIRRGGVKHFWLWSLQGLFQLIPLRGQSLQACPQLACQGG